MNGLIVWSCECCMNVVVGIGGGHNKYGHDMELCPGVNHIALLLKKM